MLGIAAVTTVVNRFDGRIWFCECSRLRFVIADAWSEHTSQHLLDPYSLTHLQHGLLFFWALLWLAPRASWPTRLVLSTAIEGLWEIAENTPWVIDRYRERTAALGYAGDSVVNSLGDLLACVAGFALARKIGWRWSLALFVAIELALLATIRDSLSLNVAMLFIPLESLKQWQMGH